MSPQKSGATCENLCGYNCTGGCYTTCTGDCKEGCTSCTNDCAAGCADGCTNQCTSCKNSCYGTCEEKCNGDCEGSCSDYCDSCEGTCDKLCYSGCTNECTSTCSGNCATVCDNIEGQTYCYKNQIYSEVFNRPFDWNSEIETGKEVKIYASDWNELRALIDEAVEYCPEANSPSGDNVESGDAISKNAYNNIADSIGVSEVDTKTKISAEVINLLKDTYNSLLIDKSLVCCQAGQNCITNGQQYPCGNQTPQY